jgi:hypothetical protein
VRPPRNRNHLLIDHRHTEMCSKCMDTGDLDFSRCEQCMRRLYYGPANESMPADETVTLRPSFQAA